MRDKEPQRHQPQPQPSEPESPRRRRSRATTDSSQAVDASGPAAPAPVAPDSARSDFAGVAVVTDERVRTRQRRGTSVQGRRAPRAGDSAALGALSNTIDELGHLLDALPDGVIIADDTGRIQFVNHQTELLFKYPAAAMIGRQVELLMPERYRAAHPAHRADYAASPHMRPMGIGLQLVGRRWDGSEFPVEISLSPIAIRGAALVLATIRDVSAQRRAEQQARDELAGRLAVLQAVLDALPVGVYLARGRDGELALANHQVAAIWGQPWPVGQPMDAFLADSGTRVYDLQGRALPFERLATLRALRTGQSVWQHQEVIRHADGTALSVLVNAVALDPHVFPYLSELHTNSAAPLPVALVVHHDVSSLAEAERLKDEFVALAAHELRNPVASLLGYAQVLLQAVGSRQGLRARPQEGVESPVSAEQPATRATTEVPEIPREWLDEAATGVVEASVRLAALTDDLVDATRLQVNQLELRIEPLEVGALVRRAVKRQRVAATARHTLTLLLPGEDAEPLLVEADAQRLEQVLTNLLSNAIKYSPEGGLIEVEALRRGPLGAASTQAYTGSVAMRDAANDPDVSEVAGAGRDAWVRVAVRDHGIGIPADQFDRIFGRFGRASNARERGLPGTGLGLYLCRELIERQGGRIWFEPRTGPSDESGTSFIFELPCWTAPA